MKSLHDTSNLYLSQIMFCKWFLIHLNINDNKNKNKNKSKNANNCNHSYNDSNVIYNVKKNVQCIDGQFKPIDNHFMDMFFYNFNDLKVNQNNQGKNNANAINNAKDNDNGNDNQHLLYLIFDTIISLLKNKIMINDLMLIFTFEICKIIDCNNHD